MYPIENGKDALALNAKFATLTASSSCTDGENACVGSGFAQCVGGKFVITQCAGGLTCAALPLVNKRGTVSFFFCFCLSMRAEGFYGLVICSRSLARLRMTLKRGSLRRGPREVITGMI